MVVNCEQVWREVSNYIDGEVEAGLCRAMDEHFQTCKRCKSVLEGMRNVVGLYGDERMMEVPAGFSRRLESKLAHPRRAARPGWSMGSMWLIPVAALVLVAGGLELASSGAVNRTPELRSEHAQTGHNIPPDLSVVVTVGARVFHLAGCGVIHNRDTARTLTARQALQEGYVPCIRCLRKYVDTAANAHPSIMDSEIDTRLEAEGKEPHRHGD